MFLGEQGDRDTLWKCYYHCNVSCVCAIWFIFEPLNNSSSSNCRASNNCRASKNAIPIKTTIVLLITTLGVLQL